METRQHDLVCRNCHNQWFMDIDEENDLREESDGTYICWIVDERVYQKLEPVICPSCNTQKMVRRNVWGDRNSEENE